MRANGDLPGVLFAFACNAVRSPMAAALLRRLAGRRIYVESAGVRPGEPDPFAIAAMDEIGTDISDHVPRGLDDLHDLSFDRIITLSPEAQHKALALAHGYAIEVDYWPAPDPTLATGAREQILGAYRDVRDRLFAKITAEFAPLGAGGV